MDIAVVGAGPAGLRAAEIAASAGASVSLFEAKASAGRKFLVAGRGGLNLTFAQPREEMASHYQSPGTPPIPWLELLAEADCNALREWAAGLGVETFVASTGRVYPRELKAAPLLRRWVQRLRSLHVNLRTGHRLRGMRPLTTPQPAWELDFEHDGRTSTTTATCVILALGGASWPQTGSDGLWTEALQNLGAKCSAWQPANCGWEHPWPPSVLESAEGRPLKNLAASAGGTRVLGELLVTRYGLEGSALYRLGPALRALPTPILHIDFKPGVTPQRLAARIGPVRSGSPAKALQRLNLGDAATAILAHAANTSDTPFESPEALATLVQSCPIALRGPRPIAEAISSAGGLCWQELDPSLMLPKLPGVFAAGEMIDWEAPTGGYLIQGCFATGTRAATGALQWLRNHDGA